MPKEKVYPLVESLNKLKSSTERLNHLTDEINNIFSLVELNLQESNIGICAVVNANDCVPPHDDFDYYLEYVKYKNAYRIVLATINDNDDVVEFTPWNELTRAIKIKLIKILPDLIRRLADELDELSLEADEAENAIIAIRNLNLGGK